MITKYLMEPNSGSVDTEENWLAEMPTWDCEDDEEESLTQQEQFDSLIEVVKDKNGNWMEV